MTTQPDEVMRGLDDLVRSGKIHYVGICNTPAWRISQMQTSADLRGWSPFVALQIEYSLVERTVEHELIPMAAALGMGVLPWSPLGGGVLTGKYARTDVADSRDASISATRKGVIASSGHLNERSIEIADVVRAIAAEVDATPSQVAIAWALLNPAVTSPVMGARTLAQAKDNLGALEVALSPEHVDRTQPGERAGSDLSRPLHGPPHGSATHLRRRIRRPARLKVSQLNASARAGPTHRPPRKRQVERKKERLMKSWQIEHWHGAYAPRCSPLPA